MITSFIIHVTLMLPHRKNVFCHGWTQLYPSTAHNLRSLTLILCYIQALEPMLDSPCIIRLSSNKRVVLLKLFVLKMSCKVILNRKKIKQLNGSKGKSNIKCSVN